MSPEFLFYVRLQLGYYGISFLIITGNIGNLLLLIILGCGLKRHVNSCSLYLFVACIANLLLIDTALASTLYGLDHLEPTHASDVICKLRWYGGHILFMLSRCSMIAACIDRWALCSRSARIRTFCRPQMAYRVLLVILAIAALLPIQVFIYFNNSSGRCILVPEHTLTYNIFAFIAIARENLSFIRTRVRAMDHSTQYVRIHKRDHDLMKMLAGEVMIYCITNVTYPINLMYGYFTRLPIVDKSPMRLAVESLLSFIVHPLLSFTYCCTQFYVCLVVSEKFRRELIQIFRRRIYPEMHAQPNTQQTEVKRSLPH